MSNFEALSTRVDRYLPAQIEGLRRLVQIPSISSDPARADQMAQSAQTVADMFAELGFDVELCQATAEDGTEGQPAVLAVKSAANPDAPTVLLYAHHDVQPLGEVDRWSYEPLELTEVGDRLYGRGSADDGAGIMVHVGALHALGEDLPVNVVVFIEGEEEIGSPSFTAFLEKYRDRLSADVIVVADSNNWTVDVPALTSSLRGVCSCDVKVEVLEHAVHSGMFGGPILDAVTLASRLIASLHDENGDVAVPGLGGNDRAEVEWQESDFRADASVVDGYQLAGTGDLAARVWTKPALAVIGMDVRPIAESSNTIAPQCTFRLSLRTVPGSDPRQSLSALTEYLQAQAPFGARVSVTPGELGPSYQADLSAPVAEKLRAALGSAWGTTPVAIGVGGSIPFISDFQAAFPGAQVLVTGVEDPQANAHSENESASRKTLRNATLAEALFLESLAE